MIYSAKGYYGKTLTFKEKQQGFCFCLFFVILALPWVERGEKSSTHHLLPEVEPQMFETTVCVV